MHSQKRKNSGISSFRRKPESSVFSKLRKDRTPVFTGVTTFCESIRTGEKFFLLVFLMVS